MKKNLYLLRLILIMMIISYNQIIICSINYYNRLPTLFLQDNKKNQNFKKIVSKLTNIEFIIRYEDNKNNSSDNSDDQFISNIDKHNKEALRTLLDLIHSNNDDDWMNIITNQGVTVERRYLTPSGSFVSNEDASKGSKHACVKSTAILDVSPDHVFNMFIDYQKAKSYNEHIDLIHDVLHFPKTSKQNWSKCTWVSTPKYGIFKPRDLLSIVNYIRYDNGTSIILNRPGYLKSHPPTDKYVRATVLLAGNIIRPHGLYGNQTHLTMLAQINPGGISDTPAAAWIINKLCASGPPSFIRQLEHAAQKTKLSISTSKRSRLLSSSSLISTTLNNIFHSNFQQSNNQFRKFLLSSMERVRAEVPYYIDPKSFLHFPWLIQSMRMYNY